MRIRSHTTPDVDRRPRRRIFRLRRALGLFLLIVLAGGTVAYFYLTDENRLRAYAEQWLSDYSGVEVRIERVRLDLLHGLGISGLTVALPEAVGFDARDNTLAGRTLLRTRTLFLRLRPFAIFTGDLVVPEITAIDPELTLIHRLADGARNWEALSRCPRRKKRLGGPTELPVIRFRNLRIVQQQLDEQGRYPGSVLTLWGDARPAPGQSETYDVQFARVLDPDAAGRINCETGRVALNLRTLAICGALPSLSVDDLAVVLPADILRKLDVYDLHGLVRAETIQAGEGTARAARLIIREGRLSVPIDEAETPLPADQRFVQLSRVNATVHLRGDEAAVDATGLFRDSPFALRGTLTLGPNGRGIEGLGFDADLDLTNVLLPLNDENTPPAERRFAQRWFKLREFVADYDPRGRADFRLHFRKLPGQDQPVQFVDGTLTARGASARYFRFPYRLHDLSGSIYFRPDGRIELRDFTGVHGRGRAVINGLVDGYVSQGLDVNITAQSIDLDDDLTSCLSEHDRRLIRLFNTQARMNLDVRLHRDPKPHGLTLAQNPWRAAVDVDFLAGTVKYEALPYSLSGLNGRMHIEGGGFEFERLQASQGPAQVELTGRVRRDPDGRSELDLQLDARGLPADDVLRDALSGQARAMYERIAPRGRLDASARIRNAPDSGEADYDVNVSLADGTLNLPDTRAQLAEVRAGVRLTPRRLTIDSLNVRFGPSHVSLAGHIDTYPGADGCSLHVISDRLVLDEQLRAALPDQLQPLWKSVNPAGPIRLDLTYARGQPIASSAAQSPQSQPTFHPATQPVAPEVRYAATIDALDCHAQLAEFPLPLERVNGRFVITPGQITLENVSAFHETLKFELAGRLNLAADDFSGELALNLRNLAFSEALRQALPGRLRRLWYDAKPEGKADVFIHRLTFARGPRGENWSAEGAADLDRMALHIGTDLTDLTGRVHGRGGAGENVFVDVDLALTEARVDGRLITDAKGHLVRPADDTHLRLTGLQGRFYGGAVLGEMEVNYGAGRPTFGLSVTARAVSLEQFLSVTHTPDQPPVTTKGTVEGTLGLSGRFGDPTSRRGGGTVFIREAQMAKIPLVLSIFRLASGNFDDNAFEDVRFAYAVGGENLLLREIDLRGKSLSMVGAGRVHVPNRAMDITLLVGSPVRLPRIEVLSDLMEGVARELLEVHVEGTLDQPRFRAEVVKSVRKAIEAIFNARRDPERP